MIYFVIHGVNLCKHYRYHVEEFYSNPIISPGLYELFSNSIVVHRLFIEARLRHYNKPCIAKHFRILLKKLLNKNKLYYVKLVNDYSDVIELKNFK